MPTDPNKGQDRNRIYGTLEEPGTFGLNVNGLPFIVVADLPEGGYLQIVPGDNPLGMPQPGPPLAKGTALIAIASEVWEKLRPMLKQAEAAWRRSIIDQDAQPDLRRRGN